MNQCCIHAIESEKGTKPPALLPKHQRRTDTNEHTQSQPLTGDTAAQIKPVCS